MFNNRLFKSFFQIGLIVTGLLAFSSWVLTRQPLTAVAAPLAVSCSIETTGDNVTDYSSADAAALQTAVNNANPNDLLKIAGTCAGVSESNGITQTVRIPISLTLQGGYTATNWILPPNPALYTTTLDAGGNGRVIYTNGGSEVTLIGLTVMNGNGGQGGGIDHHGAELTISNTQIISNTANRGGGIHTGGGELFVFNSLFQNNEARTNRGAGIYSPGGNATILDTFFIDNLADGNGGGIHNGGTMTVSASTFSGNFANYGGGIHNIGTITVNNSVLSANSADSHGGGIYNHTSTMEISDSTLSGNSAGNGGGIHNGGTMTVNASAFSGNFANYDGGGIHNDGDTVNISNSTLSDNSADYGGGIYNHTGTMEISDSTLSGNSAGNGGGIHNNDDTVNISNSTISDNRAGVIGGGINSYGDSSAFTTITDTIVSGNVISGVATADDLALFNGSIDSFSSGGYNLIGAIGANITAFANGVNGDQTGVNDPKLGALADNGGNTLTHALLDNSPAIDAGDSAYPARAGDYDQRGVGYARVKNGRLDIGAYEAPPSVCSVSVNNSGVTDYSSMDASAVQTAVNNANPDDLIKIAGTCAGVQMQGGITQTVYIDQDLTLQGGYTTTNWLAVPDPTMYPTVLDAEGNGRVAVIVNPAAATFDTLTLQNGNSSFSGGGINGGGGLMVGSSTKVTVSNSVITNNSGVNGAGIYTRPSTDLTINQSAITGNHASGSGGGLHNEGITRISNSTLSGNSANNNGGAIAHEDTELYLMHTTIANNNGGNGDGIYVNNVMTMTNSIIANNGSQNCFFDGGTHNSGDHNLDSGNSCGLSQTNDLTDTNPLLLSLADNGGNTWTHALTAGSPAIDAGDSAYPAQAGDYDQRGMGYARVQNGRLDIGAYEAPPSVCFVSINSSNTTDYDSYDASAVQTAVNNANPDDLLKIAGTCAGVQMQGGITQTVYISQNVTLQGGYTTTNWLMTPDPVLYPTVLDAEENGRVAVVDDAVTVTFDALTLQNGNDSIDGGGGLLAYPFTKVTVSNSLITNNSGVNGAGIYIYSTADLTITQSTITGNHASGSGGGLYNEGITRISNSTLSGNSADLGGGGIYNRIGTVEISDSTLSGNTATSGDGGAIKNTLSTLELIHTTIVNNDGTYGDGISANQTVMTMTNSIIANNGSQNCAFSGGTISSGNYNLDSGNSCGLSQTGDLTNTNPLLGSLADNGGRTLTHALLEGSPAIDAGDPAYPVMADDYDQRGMGYARVKNGRLDIGAYESTPPSVCSVSVNNSGVTDYSSMDTSAVQTAVNNANPNDLIKIAGTCAGVQTQGGIIQTVYISQNVTLQGGYTTTNWMMTPDPVLYPTVLDAEENGRVVYIASNTDAILNGLTIRNGLSGGITWGSGLFVNSSASLQLNHSIVVSNTNFGKGSALSNSGITTVAHSIIAHNEGTDGGGFYNGGTLTVIETAVFDNLANSDGGALQNFGQATFINSTLSGNSSGTSGGAIEHWDGSLELIHTTLANNNGRDGDGIYVRGILTMSNSIIANNGSQNCFFNGGTLNSGDHNLDSGNSCGLSQTNDLTDTNPLLLPLADNGGDTWTHALSAGSPAIDAGDSTYPIQAGDYDQRGVGYARVVNGRLDIGAYEYGTHALMVNLSGNGTVSSVPSGINCGVECSTLYTDGTVVTLTAYSTISSTFTGWTGAVISANDSITLTMDAAKSVTATFTLSQYILTTATDGSGSGSVTLNPAGGTYDYGTAVTVTHSANVGSAFTGWAGACSGNTSCVVTMDAAKSVTATFTLNQYTLTTATDGSGAGSVSLNPAGGTYDHGTAVTVTHSADAGSTFTGWAGACTGNGSCVVTMDAAKSVTATFDITQFYIFLPVILK